MWRYLFRGIFPSYRIYPWLRAYHAQDAFLFWGYRPRGSDVPLRPVERAAMAYLQNAWAAFVVNPLAGLTEFGWPHYRPNSESLISIISFSYRLPLSLPIICLLFHCFSPSVPEYRASTFSWATVANPAMGYRHLADIWPLGPAFRSLSCISR
jgi:hypothetical protein